MIKKSVVAEFKFVTTFSQMREHKRITWIPKRYHSKIAESLDKQVRVQIGYDVL
jgi:hypothetical protein